MMYQKPHQPADPPPFYHKLPTDHLQATNPLGVTKGHAHNEKGLQRPKARTLGKFPDKDRHHPYATSLPMCMCVYSGDQGRD